MLGSTGITIELTGVDGNVYAILGSARRQARRQGLSEEKWKEIRQEATSGDYDNVLQTLMKYFIVD